ncbi:glucose-1-phosphatase-like [Epargyreus clarus]|uniref:glucose-1-phosphatase-like n=1 Tax=Epargyreus clarus TaxID=520877 RepID=UPI003C2F0E91
MTLKMARKCIVLSVLTFFIVQNQGYKLKQVLILSRHNIRTPLTQNLQYTSTYEFPIWEQKAGLLTPKGVLLEGYMAEYLKEWLVKQGLLTQECPKSESIHIYANTKQRTKESAKAFANAAFKGCNVPVFSISSEEMDPVFNPVPRNASEELKMVIINEMKEKIKGLKLQDAYAELNEILNVKQSTLCTILKVCVLGREKNEIVYEVGTEPNIIGPLNLANSIVDSFLMSYYEGMPMEKVAWGKVKTQEQWKVLTKITKENQNVRFNSTILAREVAKPLLKYMLRMFERKNPTKFTLLVGHDSNLNPVMAALDFVNKDLPKQHERTPVGGKLVFQKWEDDSGKEFLKVDFVYQSFEQLRNGTKLSMENPPLWVSMQIKNCSDKNGCCPWEIFLALMRSIS